MRKGLSLLLAAALLTGNISMASAMTAQAVPGQTLSTGIISEAAAIDYVQERGVMAASTDGSFHAEDLISGQEYADTLSALLGLPTNYIPDLVGKGYFVQTEADQLNAGYLTYEVLFRTLFEFVYPGLLRSAEELGYQGYSMMGYADAWATAQYLGLIDLDTRNTKATRGFVATVIARLQSGEYSPGHPVSNTPVYGQDGLNNPDGTINHEAVQALSKQLTTFALRGGYRSSPYYVYPLNKLAYLQCTWWATGRGLERIAQTGTTTSDQFLYACHGNGGEYYAYAVAAGIYNPFPSLTP